MVTKTILVAFRNQVTISAPMKQQKIIAGSPFPTIAVDGLNGPTDDIGKPRGAHGRRRKPTIPSRNQASL